MDDHASGHVGGGHHAISRLAGSRGDQKEDADHEEQRAPGMHGGEKPNAVSMAGDAQLSAGLPLAPS